MSYHKPTWAPSEVDIEQPSAARMYDFYLGGSHNFPSDRALAEKYIQILPDMPVIARAQRAVLHRAVRFLAEDAGIDQFLDLGSGIPTAGAVHEVARESNPAARVVYVDSDSVAVAHTTALLDGIDGTGVVYADLRNAANVLANPVIAQTLDLSRPVAVLMIAVLHFVPDDSVPDPAGVVAAYRHATVPDSYLAITHATSDYHPELARRAEAVYAQASHRISYRSREEILAMLTGYELVEPGLTDMIRWRPGPDPDPLGGDVTRYSGYAAVGRRP